MACSDCTINGSEAILTLQHRKGSEFNINCSAATSNPHSLAWNIMQFEASSSFYYLYITYIIPTKLVVNE